MKEIRTQDAVGHILCHDITQIIKDQKPACYGLHELYSSPEYSTLPRSQQEPHLHGSLQSKAHNCPARSSHLL